MNTNAKLGNFSELGKEIQIFNYNGSDVTFLKGNNVMVNLTDVAKAFPDKNLTQIINSQEINDYCKSLSKLQNYSFVDLVIVKKGAPHLGGGTWAHQKVALRVAQKLSSDFAVWVDTKLEELLTQGVTTISNEDETILHAITVLQKRVDNYKQQNQILQSENEVYKNEVKTLAPKAAYTDEVNIFAKYFGRFKKRCTFATFNITRAMSKCSQLLRAIFISVTNDIKLYPYPCALAVMACKYSRSVEQQERRVLLFL